MKSKKREIIEAIEPLLNGPYSELIEEVWESDDLELVRSIAIAAVVLLHRRLVESD